MNRLGIIDWGIGGISIYRLIKEQLGDAPVSYFSDTGVTAYGKMSRGELVARLGTVVRFLKAHDVTHIVMGCNAASTVVDHLDDVGIPIEGLIEPAVRLAARLKPSSLALIGGRRTVVSGVYRKAFASRGIEVKQRVAQPLSALIERGDLTSDELRSQAERILRPIRHSSHILLACTHYPAITDVFRELVSPVTEFIDPAGEVVNRVERWRLTGAGEDQFFTSGDANQMKRSARVAFGVNIARVKKISRL